ncbi:DNA mismatch repair protein MutT [Erysipelothrix larvae]|uniref:8-oxo-dGTP diphosphatase n=1 Tax=Erysipelothrix larvae TaxID=1514105 RepID=A0A0X8H1H2_9FIRM|nr:(deoxy)nucleoside triphosphate pyrophosphohydrolase [Erysipelothrix larvae]AMC94327.1 DNA mismatch repair protein MutT [Erysipelothrix larvae]
MKKIEVVAAAVVENHKVLITQRSFGEFAGLWEFPGGKIEQGESHQDALIREISEELAFDIHPETLLITVTYQYPSFHLTMHVYVCSRVNGMPTLREHSAMKWVTVSQLSLIDWLPADIEVAHKLIQTLVHPSIK